LIEAASGTTWSVYKGSYWCGPWLQLPATRPCTAPGFLDTEQEEL
jgi:hypothetical protein